MTVGIIGCQVMEQEVRSLIQSDPSAFRLDVLEWGLHVRPTLLLERLVERIHFLENQVSAVVLAFGRCRILDQLPADFRVPVFFPPGDDCIGVLLGQDRYQEELFREAGTWFLTPGWAELGMSFIFHEIQASGLARRGIDPLAVARRMLDGYQRLLLIDTGVGDTRIQQKQAQQIADMFGWRVEKTRGSLGLLENTLRQALAV
jgi:hypothetical protein